MQVAGYREHAEKWMFSSFGLTFYREVTAIVKPTRDLQVSENRFQSPVPVVPQNIRSQILREREK